MGWQASGRVEASELTRCFITVLRNHPDHSSAHSKSLLPHLSTLCPPPPVPPPAQTSTLHVMYGAVSSSAALQPPTGTLNVQMADFTYRKGEF